MEEHKVDIYMPLFVRDFLTSTLGWSAEERGHYLTLLMVEWDRGALPAELDALERLSQGVSAVWQLLADKFPLGEDGLRRNARLEQHRGRCVELKEKRAEAGRRAASAKAAAIAARANVEQSFSKRSTNVQQTLSNRSTKDKHPTPTPTPTSSLREELNTHTHTPQAASSNYEDQFTAGWASKEWDGFLEAWNETERAAKWHGLTAPTGWVDLAASPGWLRSAVLALSMLPECSYFDTPLSITKFFEFVDRILAGEFRTKKHDRSKPKQLAGGNL